VLKSLRFTTASGRAGLELYLVEVTELYGGEGEPDKIETRMKGPIYAVDISTGTAARVLLFTCPSPKPHLVDKPLVFLRAIRTYGLSTRWFRASLS
jgi:hypothetical protein